MATDSIFILFRGTNSAPTIYARRWLWHYDTHKYFPNLILKFFLQKKSSTGILRKTNRKIMMILIWFATFSLLFPCLVVLSVNLDFLIGLQHRQTTLDCVAWGVLNKNALILMILSISNRLCGSNSILQHLVFYGFCPQQQNGNILESEEERFQVGCITAEIFLIWSGKFRNWRQSFWLSRSIVSKIHEFQKRHLPRHFCQSPSFLCVFNGFLWL